MTLLPAVITNNLHHFTSGIKTFALILLAAVVTVSVLALKRVKSRRDNESGCRALFSHNDQQEI